MIRLAVRAAILLGLGLAAVGTAAEDPSKQFAPLEDALSSWDIPSARAALARLKEAHARSDLLDFFDGRIAFEEGRYGDAIRLLESAGVDDTEGSYLNLAKETSAIVAHHEKAESEHFILFYPPGKDSVLVPYALETLEAIRTALADDLGHTPPEKVRVEVVNDARELSRVSTLRLEQIRNTGTIAICKFNKLMVTSPKAVLRGYEWRDTLAHEYVHLVVSQKTRNEAPIWLQEGLAKYLQSRWDGPPGMAMTPPTLALLGERVKKNTLIPFAKMHPSIALLPTHEDAATAFAEVFFAIDLIYRQHGKEGLKALLSSLANGKGGKDTDRRAVEAATGMTFPAFEKAWLAHVRKQPFPRLGFPVGDEVITLKDSAKPSTKSEREMKYWDFSEVREPTARRSAHLGELLRERARMGAAAEQFQKAYREVGDRYPALSNKYALSLLALKRLDEAERVLLNSLKLYPGSPSTQVHLGRIYLARDDGLKAKSAFLDALAEDPFDPEIHLSLVRVGALMKDPKLTERARQAAMTLTGASSEAVDRAAQTLAAPERDLEEGEMLSEPSVAVTPSVPSPVPPKAAVKPPVVKVRPRP